MRHKKLSFCGPGLDIPVQRGRDRAQAVILKLGSGCVNPTWWNALTVLEFLVAEVHTVGRFVHFSRITNGCLSTCHVTESSRAAISLLCLTFTQKNALEFWAFLAEYVKKIWDTRGKKGSGPFLSHVMLTKCPQKFNVLFKMENSNHSLFSSLACGV